MQPILFDGQHRRKPQQNLSGRDTTERTRDALLERAQNDRNRREKDRLVATSVRIIQAGVRGFLIRARIREAYKSKYQEIANQGPCDSLEAHGEQIGRLIKFFNKSEPHDGLLYSQHAVQLLPYKNQLLEKCLTDPLWSYRIRNFIRIGLIWFLQADGTKRITQSHRSGVKFFQALSEDMPNSDQSLLFFLNVWSDLMVSIEFFKVWREQYDIITKNPSPLHGQVAQNVEDIITILKLPFNLIPKLEAYQNPLLIDARLYKWKTYAYGKSVKLPSRIFSLRIFELFTKAFIIDNMIPSSTENRSGEVILSQLAPTFPWLSWSLSLISKWGDAHRYDHGGRSRPLLYAFLVVFPQERVSQYRNEFISVLRGLIPCVDTEMGIPSPTLGTGAKEEEIVSDPEFRARSEDHEIFYRYVKERNDVIRKLMEFLKPLPLADWISSDPLKEETVRIISCLIRSDFKHASTSFPFLNKLAYNREYLRSLYAQISQARGNADIHVFINFISLLHQLMNTLHDAEFMSAIPLQKDELAGIIETLVAKYTSVIQEEPMGICPNVTTALTWICIKCLLSLYDRNTRLHLFNEEIFNSQPITTICPVHVHNVSFGDFMDSTTKFTNNIEKKMCRVLHEYPFAIPFHDRVAAWHRMIDLDKLERYMPYGAREIIQIRRTMLYEDTYDKLSLENVEDMRNPIRISLVNTVGMLEAGVDGGGLLREFLTEATKAGVDPNRGLFRLDTQNRIYPNPIAKKIITDYWKHYFLIGRLVGKALYEQTLLELPMAGFFMQKCITGKVNLAVDYLATLDPALHNNLLSLKSFTGDFTSLGLDFTMTSNELGETQTVNLKENGSAIMVDGTNVIEYIHLVADYKINKEVEQECYYFCRGLHSVVPRLTTFSWREMQTLISGSDKPINIEDWKQHTNYSAGYTSDHRCIIMFWEVVEQLDERHLRKLLKFVTSCSRPPLLGFKDLAPNFGIQSSGHLDVVRLPTAATCMNLLKLPEYDDPETLREKLIYAIDAQAGFELS